MIISTKHDNLCKIQDYLCERYSNLVHQNEEESYDIKAELDKIDWMVIAIDNILMDDWKQTIQDET